MTTILGRRLLPWLTSGCCGRTARLAPVRFQHTATANLIDGRAASRDVLNQLRQQVAEIHSRDQARPKLAVVLVGNRPDSVSYVSMKTTQCRQVGILSEQMHLDESISQDQLDVVIRNLDRDPDVHGILVQLPLPAHLSSVRAINAIRPIKDVDGLCRYNRADISRAYHRPCTPLGILDLLQRHEVQIEGVHAVVLGRSPLVGKSVSELLLSHNATVTTCHSKTPDIARFVSQADILVSAVGKPHLVKGSWIKPGAVVIDVGINAVDDPSNPRGYSLVGDVEFSEARKVARLITPVPGGCGPMTVAMLLRNTVSAYEMQRQRSQAAAAAAESQAGQTCSPHDSEDELERIAQRG